MLKQAIATPMLPVVNLERARAFYRDVLGLVEDGHDEAKVFFRSGVCRFAVYARATGPADDHTAISFEVPDIARTVAWLRDRGVTFEEYDLPGLKTENGIAALAREKAAWFKDPDGNILCVHENL